MDRRYIVDNRYTVYLVLTAKGEKQLRDKIYALSTKYKFVRMREFLDCYPDTIWLDKKTGATLYHYRKIEWYDHSASIEFQFINKFLVETDRKNYLFIIRRYLIWHRDISRDVWSRGNFFDNPYSHYIGVQQYCERIGDTYPIHQYMIS